MQEKIKEMARAIDELLVEKPKEIEKERGKENAVKAWNRRKESE